MAGLFCRLKCPTLSSDLDLVFYGKDIHAANRAALHPASTSVGPFGAGSAPENTFHRRALQNSISVRSHAEAVNEHSVKPKQVART